MVNYLISLFSGIRMFLDFDAYWELTRFATGGIDPYTATTMQSMAPPLVFIYYLPFSLLPLSLARVINTGLNLVSGIILVWFLSNHISKRRLIAFLVLLAIFFSSFPVRFSLEQGQPIVFLTLLLLFAQKAKPPMSGLFIALASTFKPFLFLPGISKGKRTFVWSIVWIAGLLLASLLFIQPNWYLNYFQNKFLGIFAVKPEIEGIDYYNQSLRSSLFRIGLIDYYLPLYLIFWLVFVLFSLSTPVFWGIVAYSIALSPIIWQHYLVMLFPLIVLLFPKIKLASLFHKAVYILALFLWWAQFPGLHNIHLSFPTGLLASHNFISLVLLLYLVYALRDIKLGT